MTVFLGCSVETVGKGVLSYVKALQGPEILNVSESSVGSMDQWYSVQMRA